MADLRKTAGEIERLTRRFRAEIREKAKEIGRIEAKHGRYSDEYQTARREWVDMLDYLGAISSEMKAVAEAVLDAEDEYDI